MAKIVEWPNKILTKVATPVPQLEHCRDLIETLYESMDYPNGIGLSAPQIGVDKRVIAIRVPALRAGKQIAGSTKFAIINPEIFWQKGSMEIKPEGCLSFPGEQVLVPRWPRIKIRGFDIRWNPVTFGGKGLVARVLQHEIDHLNGITLDHYVRLAVEQGFDPVRPK